MPPSKSIGLYSVACLVTSGVKLYISSLYVIKTSSFKYIVTVLFNPVSKPVIK